LRKFPKEARCSVDDDDDGGGGGGGGGGDDDDETFETGMIMVCPIIRPSFSAL
jgi:hypothetical protein